MKKLLLCCVFLLAASVAFAGGINVAWGPGCWVDNPVNLKTFACDVNLGNASFTGSFAASRDIPDFVGIEVVVDLQSDATALPDWWQLFNAGACRQTSLSTSADFTAAPGGCIDPWNGLAGGGIAAYQDALFPPPPPFPMPPPNRARLKVAYAVADISPVLAGVEYYGFRATVNYQKTIGTGACAGCQGGVWICLNEIKAAGILGAERLYNPIVNSHLTWNRPWEPVAPTPAGNVTWGQVKGLYR